MALVLDWANVPARQQSYVCLLASLAAALEPGLQQRNYASWRVGKAHASLVQTITDGIESLHAEKQKAEGDEWERHVDQWLQQEWKPAVKAAHVAMLSTPQSIAGTSMPRWNFARSMFKQMRRHSEPIRMIDDSAMALLLELRLESLLNVDSGSSAGSSSSGAEEDRASSMRQRQPMPVGQAAKRCQRMPMGPAAKRQR